MDPHVDNASPIERPSVTIFTDGGCMNNPGPGGYGAVLLTTIGGKEYRKHLSEGFRITTNNRMELLGVVKALESLKKPCSVILHSDSKYVVDGINQRWVYKWRANGWSKKKGSHKPPKNVDLWKRVLNAMEEHTVTFCWVKGHSGVEENERCDQLAFQAANSNDLQIDVQYETEKSETDNLFSH